MICPFVRVVGDWAELISQRNEYSEVQAKAFLLSLKSWATKVRTVSMAALWRKGTKVSGSGFVVSAGARGAAMSQS